MRVYLLCLTAFLATAQIKPNILAPGESVWPRPNFVNLGFEDTICVKNVNFATTSETPNFHLKNAFDIYTPLIQTLAYSNDECTPLQTINIDCKSCEKEGEPIKGSLTDSDIDVYSLMIHHSG